MARIGLIGLWHLGTVAAAGLASLGHTVRATDPDAGTVAGLGRNEPPVFEPGLAEVVAREQAAGRLKFVASVAEAVERMWPHRLPTTRAHAWWLWPIFSRANWMTASITLTASRRNRTTPALTRS